MQYEAGFYLITLGFIVMCAIAIIENRLNKAIERRITNGKS